jgi:HPt (histidine-containing phosphotransfer) domain-containing protein
MSEPEPDDSRGIFDRDDLLARMGGDEQVVDAVIETFLRDAPGQLGRLRDALGSGAAEPIRLCAHSLKGAAANLSAERLRAAAQALEQAAANRDIDSISDLAEALERELDRFRESLEKSIETFG